VTGGVLFWVQHLLGSGHLRRTAAIARATAAAGVPVTVASGGMPMGRLDLGGARLVQLEPVRAGDTGFRTLVNATGAPVSEALRARRIARLQALVAETRPAVVVTETFPFGRRQLRAEALALLDAVLGLPRRAVVAASVRDILQREERPDRLAEMIATARACYDAVLVHGDPALVGLGHSLPSVAEALGERIVHTGYVTREDMAPAPPGDGVDEVVVSAGGGAVGGRLLAAAADARALSRRDGGRTWRLLGGEGAMPSLRPSPGVVVEPNRGDFRALLARCALSVSQAGYNTVTDLLAARPRAVLVPFGAGKETEQGDRAAVLAARGLARVLPESELDGPRLAAAVDAALEGPAPAGLSVDLDGAAASARRIAAWTRHG